jgi:predicted house-cleaning noncanonical NTP pyrophosphatase (MazG superfamily)
MYYVHCKIPINMEEHYEFSSDKEYEEYAQLMWLINNNN